MMTITRTLAVGAVGSVLIGTVASMTLPITAYAAPEALSGPYQYTGHFPGEEAKSATWNFTPCGSDCTLLANSTGFGSGLFQNWKFNLSDGRWTYSGQQDEACFGGGTVPIAINASFDAEALTGEWQRTQQGQCGQAPASSDSWTFELSKAG